MSKPVHVPSVFPESIQIKIQLNKAFKWQGAFSFILNRASHSSYRLFRMNEENWTLIEPLSIV